MEELRVKYREVNSENYVLSHQNERLREENANLQLILRHTLEYTPELLLDTCFSNDEDLYDTHGEELEVCK